MTAVLDFLLVVIAVAAVSLAVARPATDAGDKEAMIELAAALDAERALQWSSSADPCTWIGVSCDGSGRVTAVQARGRNLSGSLHPSVRNLTALTRLELMRNSISGPLPTLSGLGTLQILLLHGNQFSSIPDDFFTGLSSLQAAALDDNPIGSIPPSLIDATTIVNFTASNCSIAGSIPSFFGTVFPVLKRLSLSYNLLEGPVPPVLASSPIQFLMLNSQKGKQLLSGHVDFIGNMTGLQQLWLHSNSFTGPLPDFTLLTSLQDIRLRDNLFTGPVPDSLLSLGSLTNLLLAGNHLQGPMPVFSNNVVAELDNNGFCLPQPGECDKRVGTLLGIASGFGYPIKFAESWKGNDPCIAGWTGITCGAGGVITSIIFSNLGLNGTMSAAFSNLSQVQSIVLAHNNISGTIPESLTSLKQLKKLDLSYNNLFGILPSFPSSVNVDVSSNPNLGNAPPPEMGSKAAPPEMGSTGSGPASITEVKTRTALSVGVVIGCVIAAAIASFLVFICVYCCYRKKGKQSPLIGGGPVKKPNGVIFLQEKSGSESLLSESNINASNGTNYLCSSNIMTFEELSRATNTFSEKNVLGSGGFGHVYHGVMDNGTNVAVKRMTPGSLPSNGMKEFQAEIEVLSRLRHRNIVCLLGYCCEGEEKLLVYEYMPEGTLTHHLHDLEKSGKWPLEWKRRLNIALDVARGIEYLHGMSDASFIHRDLKPSNILLGKNMNAKVADFGLIRHSPGGNNASVETRLAGTFGYMAPEYVAIGRVTTKADVYSYGIILMELITGRKALDEKLSEQNLHLVKWFRRIALSNQLHGVIDPIISQDEETLNVLTKVSQLAINCCHKEPSSRPDIGHAVLVLNSFTDRWIPSTTAFMDDDASYQDRCLIQAVLLRQQDDIDDSSLLETSTAQRAL